MERRLDLTISDSHLWLRARDCEDAELELGEGNRTQGLRWEDGIAVMDPLSDEEFGADVIVRTPERFSADKRAQRTLKIPFSIPEGGELVLGSPEEEIPVGIPLPAGDYTLIYEICVARDVFYTLTLLPEKLEGASALKTDGWGLKKDQALVAGAF
ncbi:MAG: competence protein ComJ [Moraxellaceae bacterium]